MQRAACRRNQLVLKVVLLGSICGLVTLSVIRRGTRNGSQRGRMVNGTRP